jgi:hypothetical protein
MVQLRKWIWTPLSFIQSLTLYRRLKVVYVTANLAPNISCNVNKIYNCSLYNFSCIVSKGIRNHFSLIMKFFFSFFVKYGIFSLDMIKCHTFSLAVQARENMWHCIMFCENIFHISIKRNKYPLISLLLINKKNTIHQILLYNFKSLLLNLL